MLYFICYNENAAYIMIIIMKANIALLYLT